MEFRNVITFLRVAERRNFTQAASILGYSQSTVTVQIRQLEEELGYPLFDRIGKTVSLTPAGERFLPYANRLASTLAQISALENETPQPGVLKLGILESLMNGVFLSRISRYCGENPNIRLEIHIASGEELFGYLRRNETDIIFTLGKRIPAMDCVRAFEHRERMMFVVKKGYFGTSPGGNMNFKELLELPLVLTESNSMYRKELEQAAVERDMEIRPLITVNSSLIVRNLVRNGMGAGFLPEYVVRKDLDQEILEEIMVDDYSTEMWSQIFYHRNKWVTPQMNAFVRAIEDYYRDEG